jgi:hypothetical protein
MQYLRRTYLQRTYEMWPYFCMAVSLMGLLYIGLNAIR